MMRQAIRKYVLVIAATLSLIIVPCAAQAQAFSCGGGGGGPQGDLFPQTEACQFAGVQHIFSMIICNFISVMNGVVGLVYCAIQQYITPILAAVLTLFIATYGAQMLMGTAQLNARDFISRLLKIMLVWTFVTQASWSIGIGLNFFLSLLSEGSYWVLKTVLPDANANPNQTTAIYGYIDDLVYQAISGPFTKGNAKLIGFFAVMGMVVPILFMMALYWLWTTLSLLTKVVIGFLLAVSAICFLITLSPIFLSFMLFQSTSRFFESWLRYMTSYVLQVIIVFAIVALWMKVMFLFKDFATQMADLVYPYRNVVVVAANHNPQDTWGLCPATYGVGPNGPTASCPAGFDPTKNAKDAKDLIPHSKVVNQKKFLYFVTYHLGALIIIAFTFNGILKITPYLVKDLAGPANLPLSAGGWGSGGGGKAGAMGRNTPPGVPPPPARRIEAGGGPVQKAVAQAQALVEQRKPLDPVAAQKVPVGGAGDNQVAQVRQEVTAALATLQDRFDLAKKNGLKGQAVVAAKAILDGTNAADLQGLNPQALAQKKQAIQAAVAALDAAV